MRQSSFEEAAKHYERILELTPDDTTRSRAHYFLGKIRLIDGDVDSAITRLTRTLELMPESDASFTNVAVELADLLFRVKQDADAAWEILEKMGAHEPTGAKRMFYLLHKAKILDSRGNVQEAIEMLEQALDEVPWSIPVQSDVLRF